MSILTTLFGAKTQQNDTYTVLDKPSFEKAISSKKVQLVDVRTSREFKSGHIKNVVNIDFFNHSSFASSFNRFNKEEPIYIYCRSGSRSRKASRVLDSLGFKKIYDLRGGFMNWSY